MASNSVEKVISHYQRDIDKICSRPDRALKYEDRLLHCLTKLQKLPITVSHLQLTGVGKTVNALRKIPSKKGLNDAAKALVAKWKAMVIEEDDLVEADSQPKINGTEDEKRRRKVEERKEYSTSHADEEEEVGYTPGSSTHSQDKNLYSPQSTSQHSATSYTPSKKCAKPNGYSPSSSYSSRTEVLCYSPSKRSNLKYDDMTYSPTDFVVKSETLDDSHSKSKKGNEGEKSSKHKSKRSHDESKSNKESSKSSSSKEKNSKNHKHSSSSSKHASGSSKSSSKEKHASRSKDESSSTRSLNSAKESSKSEEKISVKKKTTEVDSQSGASFAEALGPILVKKKRKSRVDDTCSKPSTSDESKSSHVSKKTPQQLLDDVAGPSHLAPLDANLVSTLSVPNPNYRPMPQPPVCLADKKLRIQNEEDALTRIMSNKNSRTKVYSGVRGGLSYVPSLYECCCRVLQQHIDFLEYTGGIPFDLLKPVLDGATPEQLYQFEDYNPYIIGDTEDLWKFHVQKDFRGKQREELEGWRDMYLRCVDEREQKYKAVTANIQESLKKSVPVRQTKLAYVDVAKPPRNILRKQIKNGTGKPDVSKLLGKDNPEAVVIRPSTRIGAPSRDMFIPPFKPKPKVAPLMQKTLKSIKQTRYKR